MKNPFKKLTNDEFNERCESIIILYSIPIFLLMFIISWIFGFRYAVSMLIAYCVSILVFLKDSLYITKLVHLEMYNYNFWRVLSYIGTAILYVGITLLFVLVDYFSLIGLIALFTIEISTIILGIIYRK